MTTATLKNFFYDMPGYAAVVDRDFKIVANNRKFSEDCGDGVGSYCYEFFRQREDKCPSCSVEKTFKDSLRHNSEETLTLKDGQKISVIVYTSPVINKDGEVEAVVEVATDITDIKRLQDEYQALFREVPCYISVQDRDLKIVEANRLFKDDFGDGIGTYCYETYKHRDKPCVDCLVKSTFEDGVSRSHEEVVTSKSNKQINVLAHTAAIKDPSGKIVFVMEMSANITEIRRLQSQLTSIGLVVSSAAHDIKGLLGGLGGGHYLVESGIQKNSMARVKQGWDMVQRNLQRIRNMTFNLLYYTKEREVKWESFNIMDVIDDVSNFLQNRAKELKLDFKIEVGPDLGEIEGEANAIHSLLVNLLENSLDACRFDSIKADHQVVLKANNDNDGDRIIFEISDNGIGMDQETKDKVFTLFYSNKGHEGTGLGLFVANKIVHAHNGEINIESSVGKGTTFLVKLPRQR